MVMMQTSTMMTATGDELLTSSPETAISVVGQRLSLRLGKANCPGMVIAYFPKTQKHRVRLEGTDGSFREKNFRLEQMDYSWLEEETKSSTSAASYDLAIRRDAVGRRLEIYHQVRQKWYQGTILRYVEHCQQHAIKLEHQGKVYLVDLSEQMWRFTDLIGATEQQQKEPDVPQSLATSKYMGVQRFTESTWKAYYVHDTDEELYIGCFGREKDAALAYDVYARKRGTPVNFGDRRICRKAIKPLIVPEPEIQPEMTSSALMTPELTPATPESTTSNAVELEPTDAPPLLDETSMLMEDKEVETPSLVDQVEENETEVSTSDDKSPATKGKPMIDITKVDKPVPEVHRRISLDDEDEEATSVIEHKKHRGAKKAASKVQEEDEEESEFEFGDMEEEEEEEEESSGSSSSSEEDEEEEEEIRAKGRKSSKKCALRRKMNKPTANLFDSSSDEEEEEERMIARQMKKRGRARALQELGDFNTPPACEMNDKSHKKKKRNKSKRKRPKYPVGTRFLKEFPGYGTFEGRVTEWDGTSYHVYYSEDEDREEFGESDMEDYKIVSVPGGFDRTTKLTKKSKKKRRKMAHAE